MSSPSRSIKAKVVGKYSDYVHKAKMARNCTKQKKKGKALFQQWDRIGTGKASVMNKILWLH